MQITDLMKGDLVIYHDSGWCSDGSRWETDRFCQVTGINGDLITVEWTCEDGDKENEGHISLTDISPVKLTQEILDKNFPDDEPGYIVGYWPNEDGESFQIELELGEDESLSNNFVHLKECKYVHKLQHAIKACEIEKEIVL